MIDLLIKDTTIVTVNAKREILYHAAIAIDQGRIVAIGESKLLEQRYAACKKTISAEEKAVFPGLINTHNHLFQTNLKGMGDDKVLKDWLTDMTFPSAAHLNPEDCYTGAMIGCLEGLHSGVTTQLDYMYPHPVDGLDEAVIQCFKDLKIRGIFGRGYMDTGECYGVQKAIMQTPEKIAADVRYLVEKYHNTENGRLQICLAPAAVWSNSPASWEMTKKLYDELKINLTVHISETPFDREASEKLHGMPDIDVLESYGLMGPRTLMVHCVYLTDRDIRMCKVFDAKISHNPASNMYLSSGVAPIPKLNMAGVDVSLATDGAGSNNSNDMIEILKLAALLQKVHHKDPTVMTAEKVLEMATIEGAKAVGLENEIGSLEVGKKADLFIFNPELNFKAIPMHHPVSTLVYSASMQNVETVVIDGNIIMENSKVLLVDELAMAKRCRLQADDLAKRAGTLGLKTRVWKSLAY